MKTYGILLIGCGHIGMQHLENIYFRPDIRIEGVIDQDPMRAQEAARRSSARAWGTDYHRFLDSEAVDIAIIATYTDSHLPILLDCLTHHKHVLCEKPIARTREEGLHFVKAVRSAPEKVLIAHILRHNRSYGKIRELIRNGAVGELKMIRMIQNHHAMNWERYCRLLMDCSPTVDCGVHYYDLVQWITGSPIVEVSGFGTKTQEDAPQENYTMITYRLENGCAGFYEAGWGQSLRACNVKEFIGTKGCITLEMKMQRSRDYEEGDCITLYHSDSGVYETINIQSEYKDMYAQLETLIHMIETDMPGTPSIEDVWSAFCVALAAERSIKDGRTISIEREE